ncbi:MAG: hypothetical protein IJN29_03445 [Akkermansia sp.]|nr:hypothetical protein [Akkermansia sp.]
MGIIRTIYAVLLAVCLVTAPFAAAEADDNKSRAEQRKALREAEKKAKDDLKKAKKSGDAAAIKMAEDALADIEMMKKGGLNNADMDKEFDGLREAQALLAEVNDEKSAEKAAKKISSIFGRLPAPIEMTDGEIEQWSIEQNKVSAQMERLRKMPFFESSGLQEAWTNVSDPFSRKRAQRAKK